MMIFDYKRRVLRTPSPLLSEEGFKLSISFAESLHAKFYLHEVDFLPSGVSVVALSVEDTPEESIFSGP